MLPDLLFSVGGSMQDITRDECDINSASTHTTDSSLIKLPRTPDLEPSIIIKLEDDSPDITYPWSELGSNLLNHSDDPLLSRGNDDNQNEFSALQMAPQHNFRKATPNMPKKATTPRVRKKGQFKLRFHHQALPQEYLDHYEASQKVLASSQNGIHSTRASAPAIKFSSVLDTPESPQDRTNENIRNWLQKISELQNEGVPLATNDDCVPLPTLKASASRSIGSVSDPHPLQEKSVAQISAKSSVPSTSKVVNYNDLPFMGEMTLDNSKPRRGRKPKKADICHLIYKNYGTIFPGTPVDIVDANANAATAGALKSAKKADLQNKISSLLEKRLTVKGEIAVDGPLVLSKKQPPPTITEEPLNLCLRDSLADEVDSLTVSSDNSGEDDEALANNLELVLPNLRSTLLESNLVTGSEGAGVLWPDANLYMHPMALYYQKLVDASTLSKSNPGHVVAQYSSKNEPQQSKQPKYETNVQTPPVRAATASSISSLNSSRPCPTPSSSGQPALQKRKRSAIFIPPMPLETSSNPATEVSICKFKFTGGAKPTLQEKKMLSVDSGGNFRYYSGTGDKSMRGYEFFPRERLQQSALVAGSSAGAFLNAHGEKINMDMDTHLAAPGSVLTPLELISENSTTASSNQSINRLYCATPSRPSTSLATVCPPHLALDSYAQQPTQASNPATALDRRKRKSRRSIQRELEKTFKEKGFLIQTQQTESAGATYCKFRQLKKFTRYLFRSWKNYLPGDLQQQQQQLHGQPTTHDHAAN